MYMCLCDLDLEIIYIHTRALVYDIQLVMYFKNLCQLLNLTSINTFFPLKKKKRLNQSIFLLRKMLKTFFFFFF